MNCNKVVLLIFIFNISLPIFSQETAVYTNKLTSYYHAIELYQNKNYAAAQQQFNAIKNQFNASSEYKANCDYYIANAALRLNQPKADDLMLYFVNNYPTNTSRNNAFLETGNYYFSIGKFAYAAKWYTKVNTLNLTLKNEADFNFRFAYSLFINKNYDKAKQHFLNLLDNQIYGSQAKYYYGYIAYNQNDYTTANKYLNEVASNITYKKDVSYYLADINFKLGNFEKAIQNGLPLLENANLKDRSEISKIIGESYFNLQKYSDAIPYLKNYKGSFGKWNNTDYYLLGYSYFKENDLENAINYFNKIIDGTNEIAQNAFYHLGYCYLKLDKKSEALNAFRNASQMSFKQAIQSDAWLNYAKLSYEIGNPYESVPTVLKTYLDRYPNSPEKEEINNLIVSSYFVSQDFKSAIDYLKNKKGTINQQNYQKASFYLGIQLFNSENYVAALQNFNNALTASTDPVITSKAAYWKAESNYKLGNYNEALENYNFFKVTPSSDDVEEYKNLQYALGYVYFNLKEYEKATWQFKQFAENKNSNKTYVTDSYLRLGDSNFMSRKYENAITYYNKAISLNSVESDYAQYQKAISFGLINDENSKIDALHSFIKTYKNSVYSDDVYYALGNSYIKKNNPDMAITTFNNLIETFKRSPLVSKALLKKGLVYYNNNQNEKALEAYKTVVSKFPSSEDALQAVKNSRQIYIDLGNVDEYANWIKTLNFVNVSNAEVDNDMYEAAEKQYFQKNNQKAIENFKKYLTSFPTGLHALQANNYLAETYVNSNQKAQAIPYFETIMAQPQNEFTEKALTQVATIYMENYNWKKAVPVLEQLEKAANSNQNKIFAQSNLMKGYYELENYKNAEDYAVLILTNQNLDSKLKADAQLIIARSAVKNHNDIKAKQAYKELEPIALGELKAEALYYNAYYENKDGSYRVSNKIIQDLVANYATYKYWGAKALLVMADNFYQLKDAYQATYILESAIKNFTQFSDVVSEATSKLNNIKAEEAKTNESVKN